MPLTPEQVERFERDGFLAPIPVLAEAEVARYRNLFDELEARLGRETASNSLTDYHFKESFIWELATHPKVLDCMEALIGPDIALLASHFFCKYGQQEKFVAWHQDVTYWGLEPPFAVSAWLAIDDSDRENGCMRVIPGTHQDGIREHGKADQDGNLLSINQEIPVTEAEEGSAADLILRAGEMSLHHGTVVHGSLPNRSTRRRCGLTVPYLPTGVKVASASSLGVPFTGVLVRGEDPDGNYSEHPMPFPLQSL